MQQNGLFNIPQKKPTPTPQQSGLFGNVPTKREPESRRSGVWVPTIGDRVIVESLNDGIEGVIDYIDHPNLYVDHAYPIQLRIPKLNDMMYRCKRPEIKLKTN